MGQGALGSCSGSVQSLSGCSGQRGSGHYIVPFVGLVFLASMKQKVFFPSLSLASRLYWYWDSSWRFFVVVVVVLVFFFFSLNSFGLAWFFFFSACSGSRWDCPEPETSEELNQHEKRTLKSTNFGCCKKTHTRNPAGSQLL